MFEVGSTVLVNGSLVGTVLEAEQRQSYFAGGRPFCRYLVRLEDGSVEGFTDAYLRAAS